MTNLAKTCIQYRATNGLTQEELAEKCGLCRATIIYTENGRKTVSAVTEAKIRSVVGRGQPEVTYCKDCGFWGGVAMGGLCRYHSGEIYSQRTGEYDFCSFAVKAGGD